MLPLLFFESGTSPVELAGKAFEIIKKGIAQRVVFCIEWSWYGPLQDISVIKKMSPICEENVRILGLNARAFIIFDQEAGER
jgi:hypothetical protein